MRDISNFGNNLRDEIIEYRLEHETGYTIKPKFVDKDDKTYVCFSLYSKSGDLLSDSEPPVLFDPAGQRVVDDVKLIRGSSKDHTPEYEIKVVFRGGKDPIYCPVDDILTTLRKELSNKITIDLDNSRKDESSVITSKIYNTSGEELSESHISLDNINISKAKIDALDVTGDIKADGISITANGQLKIGDAVLNEATLTKLIALAESMTETESK